MADPPARSNGWADTKDWPERHRRQYDWAIAMGNLWVALAEGPIARRIGLLRREFERRAILSYAAAIETEREVLAILAVTPAKQETIREP